MFLLFFVRVCLCFCWSVVCVCVVRGLVRRTFQTSGQLYVRKINERIISVKNKKEDLFGSLFQTVVPFSSFTITLLF